MQSMLVNQATDSGPLKAQSIQAHYAWIFIQDFLLENKSRYARESEA